jgi:serine/threonine protein kinase
MVMELVPLGGLDKLLLLFGEFLRTSAKLSMCEQVCSAMAELSAEGLLHRDLATRNVLVASLDPVHVKVRTVAHMW